MHTAVLRSCRSELYKQWGRGRVSTPQPTLCGSSMKHVLDGTHPFAGTFGRDPTRHPWTAFVRCESEVTYLVPESVRRVLSMNEARLVVVCVCVFCVSSCVLVRV